MLHFTNNAMEHYFNYIMKNDLLINFNIGFLYILSCLVLEIKKYMKYTFKFRLKKSYILDADV